MRHTTRQFGEAFDRSEADGEPEQVQVVEDFRRVDAFDHFEAEHAAEAFEPLLGVAGLATAFDARIVDGRDERVVKQPVRNGDGVALLTFDTQAKRLDTSDSAGGRMPPRRFCA